MSRGHGKNTRIVRLIGAAKLIKGLLLLLVGIGALHFVRRDLNAELSAWAEDLNLDPNNAFLRSLLERLGDLTPNKKAWLAVGTFVYSALFLTEGVGLLLDKLWAEYFALIITASFLPIEGYELAKHFTAVKLVVTILNAAIVAYLAVRLYRSRRH